MIVKLLTEHHLVFLSLKRGCTGLSESTYVKMPHCWKPHALAHLEMPAFNWSTNLEQSVSNNLSLGRLYFSDLSASSSRIYSSVLIYRRISTC